MTARLMIPGPVRVAEEVLREMGGPVQAHYGAEWTAIQRETLSLLQQVFQTKHEAFLLVGSGSSGLDAAIGSLTVAGETIIVGANGFFGDRLTQIGTDYGLQIVRVEADLGQRLDPEGFSEALDRHPDAAAIALVHLETSTSVVNPLQEIASVAQMHGVPIIVDAVSSLGGLPLPVDAWDIDICVSSSQKCLGAPPGLAPISISERAWEIMASKPGRGHGWYLNLETWRRFAKEWADWHPFPVTMATNNVLAVRAALRSLLAEGLETRIARYTGLAMRLRNGVRELGLEPLTPDDQLAPVLTAIYGPEGIATSEIVRFLLENHNLRISGGLGEDLQDRVFRVGHMSPLTNEADIDDVLAGLADFLGDR